MTNLKGSQLNGAKAAIFDIRVKLIYGDAGKKIVIELGRAGAEIVSSPGYFYIRGKEGQLLGVNPKKLLTGQN